MACPLICRPFLTHMLLWISDRHACRQTQQHFSSHVATSLEKEEEETKLRLQHGSRVTPGFGVDAPWSSSASLGQAGGCPGPDLGTSRPDRVAEIWFKNSNNKINLILWACDIPYWGTWHSNGAVAGERSPGLERAVRQTQDQWGTKGEKLDC